MPDSVRKTLDPKCPNNLPTSVNILINGEETSYTADDAIVNAGIGCGDNFINCEVLMDSGACYNCITPTVLDRMRSAGVSFKVESSSRRDPGAANGQRMPILGEVKLNLVLKGRRTADSKLRQAPRSQEDNEVQLQNCYFVILKELNHEVILGCKALRALQFTMGRDEIKIGPDKISIGPVARGVNGVETLRLLSQTTISTECWGLYVLEDCGVNEIGTVENREVEDDSRPLKPGEMQPVVLVPFAKGEEIPERILREKEISAPGIKNIEVQPQTNNNEQQKQLADILEKQANSSDFSPAGKVKLRKILDDLKDIFSTSATDVGKYRTKKRNWN